MPRNSNLLIEIFCRRNGSIGFYARHQIGCVCRCIGIVMHGSAIPTVGRVPLMFAVNPRKHFLEATEEVVEGPSDDDIVIGGEEK